MYVLRLHKVFLIIFVKIVENDIDNQVYGVLLNECVVVPKKTVQSFVSITVGH